MEHTSPAGPGCGSLITNVWLRTGGLGPLPTGQVPVSKSAQEPRSRDTFNYLISSRTKIHPNRMAKRRTCNVHIWDDVHSSEH